MDIPPEVHGSIPERIYYFLWGVGCIFIALLGVFVYALKWIKKMVVEIALVHDRQEGQRSFTKTIVEHDTEIKRLSDKVEEIERHQEHVDDRCERRHEK